nr:hypothetical protein [Tanacetum cinerariifolium]
MGYENSNTTPETESDEIIKSGVEELVPNLSENEVTSEDKKDIHFLEELHSDNSIPLTEDESSDSDHKDDPLVPRPPPEPPDADFEPDSGEEISVVMNTIDELECVNPKDEFDDDNYSSFMFLIYLKMFSFLLSAESEDTIFDPGISV